VKSPEPKKILFSSHFVLDRIQCVTPTMIHHVAYQCSIAVLVTIAAIVNRMLAEKKLCVLKEAMKNLVDVFRVLIVEIVGTAVVVNVGIVVDATAEIVVDAIAIFKNNYAQC